MLQPNETGVNWKTNWNETQAGATATALEAMRAALPASLPGSFYDLLAFSNGGEWPAGQCQFSFRLLSAEEIAENVRWAPSKPNEAHEFLRGFILIGSNGSGLCVGFDIRGEPPWPIVEVDAGADDDERVVAIARDFDAFLDILGA